MFFIFFPGRDKNTTIMSEKGVHSGSNVISIQKETQLVGH